MSVEVPVQTVNLLEGARREADEAGDLAASHHLPMTTADRKCDKNFRLLELLYERPMLCVLLHGQHLLF